MKLYLLIWIMKILIINVNIHGCQCFLGIMITNHNLRVTLFFLSSVY